MKRLCFLIFMTLLLPGCSRSGLIEQRIGDRVNTCNATAPCIVKIKDLTDFPWDQMHVFQYNVSQEEIQRSLGTDFPNYTEFTRRIVFLKDGKIIRREDEPTDIERLVNGQVTFAESDTGPHRSYTPETAVFRAEKKSFEGGVYYALTLVK
jgi:hypothetical protein